MPAVPRSRYFVFTSIAVGGCLADLLTKRIMFSWLGMPCGVTRWLWPNVMGFQTSLNEGALFGMYQGQTRVFALLSLLAAAAIIGWLFIARAATDRLLTVALAMITAGIMGNLYDRLGLPGLTWHFTGPLHAQGDAVYAVRDWILVMIGAWPWPNFNLADVFLDGGAILLLWQAFVSKPETAEAKVPG